MSKIIGVVRSAGEYQGRPYDNVKFYLTDDFSPDNEQAFGSYFLQGDKSLVKVKAEIVQEEYPFGNNLEAYIGINCTIVYDMYGRPTELKFTDELY